MIVVNVACGKKGPPLPPIVHLPAPPPDFVAERRGDDVRLQFTIPTTNTDGTRPANIERVDVYAFTGTFTANDEQVIKYGRQVASVPVKAPKDPDLTTEADEPPEEPELKEEGLDQGAVAQLDESLGDSEIEPVELPKEKTLRKRKEEPVVERPLLGPPGEVLWTYYLLVPVNTNGKKGPSAKRAIVPLVPAPAPPTEVELTYDESGVLLKWQPSVTWAPVVPLPPREPALTAGGAAKDPKDVKGTKAAKDADNAEDTEDDTEPTLLPSRFFGMPLPSLTYNVYDVSPPAPADAASPSSGPAAPAPAAQVAAPLGTEIRLAKTPIGVTEYFDPRTEWGRTMCYVVRAIETITGQTLESETPKPVCVTLKDTFPPAPPKNLQSAASEGVINLIWDPNTEKDLAGYVVLRGTAADNLARVTPTPITATVFEDKVAAGMRYIYAVEAVDRAGNVSLMSNTIEDAAR